MKSTEVLQAETTTLAQISVLGISMYYTHIITAACDYWCMWCMTILNDGHRKGHHITLMQH